VGGADEGSCIFVDAARHRRRSALLLIIGLYLLCGVYCPPVSNSTTIPTIFVRDTSVEGKGKGTWIYIVP